MSVRLSCSVCVLAVLVGAHASLAAETARLPRPRPIVETPKSVPQTKTEIEAWAESVEARFRAAGAEVENIPAQEVMALDAPARLAATEQVARLPRPRPDPARLLALAAPEAAVEAQTLAPVPRIEVPEDTACLARLVALGVTFTKEEPIDDGLCWVQYPLKVTSLGSGVEILPEATMTCRTAEALAEWTKDVLVPVSRDMLEATPTKIVHSSTYICRTRNGDPDAKLSEHALANAVDVSSIAFAERGPFNIADYEMTSEEGQFQVAIRKGACDHFATVLGPRSDDAHATHFHLDMMQRRGGYRLCDLADTNFVGVEEP
jgi:hypothetical protein